MINALMCQVETLAFGRTLLMDFTLNEHTRSALGSLPWSSRGFMHMHAHRRVLAYPTSQELQKSDRRETEHIGSEGEGCCTDCGKNPNLAFSVYT